MQLRDKCSLSGGGLSTAPRRCMFYSAEGTEVLGDEYQFRFKTQARVTVLPDPAMEAMLSPINVTVTHHGRTYDVEGVRHQYSNRGKLLLHTLELKDVQG